MGAAAAKKKKGRGGGAGGAEGAGGAGGGKSGGKSGDKSGEESTYDTVNKLDYNRAVFKEVLRLFPPAPLTVRHTTKESVIGGVRVPADVMLYIPIWWVHRSEHNWKHPNEFRPERFMRPPDTTADKPEKDTGAVKGAAKGGAQDEVFESELFGEALKDGKAHGWVPFSGGQRNCVGQRFAMIEGTLMLAKIIEKLDFAFEDGYEPHAVGTGPVQAPHNPMKVTVTATADL